MPSREDLRRALRNGNVRAFLRVIREGETDQTDDAYRKLVGDPPGVYSLNSLNSHPHKIVWIGYLKVASSAAGAYQFLSSTWDEMEEQYDLEDFSPKCQDEAAVGLIARRKSLDAIMTGDLSTTLLLCSYEWASLPPGRYGQPAMSTEEAFKLFDKWGGHYSYSKGVDV